VPVGYLLRTCTLLESASDSLSRCTGELSATGSSEPAPVLAGRVDPCPQQLPLGGQCTGRTSSGSAPLT
jgi:hypothetical protein